MPVVHGWHCIGLASNAGIAYIAVIDNEALMATLTIRNIEPEMHRRLRVQAAEHGRSMEAELRQILKDAVGAKTETGEPEEVNLAEAIRRIFAPMGGAELELPPRGPGRPPPNFNE